MCGVRSPPSSGKTMVLPELLLEWSYAQEETWEKAVMIVFPTQFGCQNIKESLIDFRGHKASRLTLRTGIHKQDWVEEGYTSIQIVTYGMLWHWLVKCGQEGVAGTYQEAEGGSCERRGAHPRRR